ncbi:MAG TPA: alpha/beta hydrolase [Candidatus Dormibacteraeota bacterium]
MVNEVSALIEVVGEAVDQVVVSPAQSMHRAIANRTFTAVGPPARPLHRLYQALTDLGYEGVRTAAATVTRTAAATARTATPATDLRPLSDGRRGRFAIAAINGFLGDRLVSNGNELAIRMSLRKDGADLPVSTTALAEAFPAAGSRVAVFIHGLAENEEAWRGAFGSQLELDLGITPLYIRYNSGLEVSRNGADLAGLMESLVRAWPVELTKLYLVGHSMGGLVARSAVHIAQRSAQRWPNLLVHLVTLGTPHSGAPLEKAVHLAAWALRQVPEAAAVAEVLDLRSAGIRDLRHGYVDPPSAETPSTYGQTYVAATVTRSPGHPLGWIVGDLLVRSASAHGRHGSRSVSIAGRHVGSLTHFDLLDHPSVYECVRAALL